MLDKPFAQLRGAYHLSEEDAPNLVLIPNPLDTADAVLARRLPDGTHVIVFGPPASGALNPKPILKAYSALLAQEATASVSVKGIDDAVQKLRHCGTLSAEVTAENMVRDSLRSAVESKLWGKEPEAEIDSAYKKGLLYAPEFLKAIGQPANAFPAKNGTFAAQVVARVDFRKYCQIPIRRLTRDPEHSTVRLWCGRAIARRLALAQGTSLGRHGLSMWARPEKRSCYRFGYLTSHLAGPLGYAGVLVLLMVCGLGVPVPEDIILISGGYIAASGRVPPGR